MYLFGTETQTAVRQGKDFVYMIDYIISVITGNVGNGKNTV